MVAIKIDMPMPESCPKCRFYLGGFVCSLTLSIVEYGDAGTMNCPLIDLEDTDDNDN